MKKVFVVKRDDSDFFYVLNERGSFKVMYHPDDTGALMDAIEEFAELNDLEMINLVNYMPPGSVPEFQINNETFLHDDDEALANFLKIVRYYIKHYEALKLMGM